MLVQRANAAGAHAAGVCGNPRQHAKIAARLCGGGRRRGGSVAGGGSQGWHAPPPTGQGALRTGAGIMLSPCPDV